MSQSRRFHKLTKKECRRGSHNVGDGGDQRDELRACGRQRGALLRRAGRAARLVRVLRLRKEDVRGKVKSRQEWKPEVEHKDEDTQKRQHKESGC